MKRLREIKSDLIKQVRGKESERNELRRIRDGQNQSVKELFELAKISRENRDEVNEDVKLNKALRDLRKEDAEKALNELEELEGKIKGMGINPKGRSKTKGIARQIRDLEMRIETTPNLHPETEKEYVSKIEKLTQDIDLLEVADEKRDEIRVIQKRLRSLRNEAMSHHKEVKKLANQSQEYHDVMLEKIQEARKIRVEADKNHKKVIDLSQEIKGIRKEINSISTDSDQIRKKLGEETIVDRRKRKQKEAKIREDELDIKATDILNRYQSGEKLGFEEFKLIVSRGLLNTKKD